MAMTTQMQKKLFKDVKVGGFFKESITGSWHLKISPNQGQYSSSTFISEPKFAPDDIVFVEQC